MNLLAIVGGAWLALLLVGSLVASWAIRRNRREAAKRYFAYRSASEQAEFWQAWERLHRRN